MTQIRFRINEMQIFQNQWPPGIAKPHNFLTVNVSESPRKHMKALLASSKLEQNGPGLTSLIFIKDKQGVSG